MSNYNIYSLADDSLTGRFDNTTDYPDGYVVLGLREWHRYIDLLVRYLVPPENPGEEERLWQEERERIREVLFNEVLVIHEDEVQQAVTPKELRVHLETRSPEDWILYILLHRLRALAPLVPRNPCPRLFISHRQTDKEYALRMAWLAQKNKFAYWIDILDPVLSVPSAATGLSQPLLTACIIEMALLNCTHVIALMTPNSPGSAWIPYEYGRVKNRRLVSFNVAAWIHPRFTRKIFPDYMCLGQNTYDETQIEKWMTDEYLS